MTMTELAKLAGVSQSTVSLVLNRREGRRIHPKTEEHILKLAKEHHFRVNRAAADLRRRTSSAIGVIMVTPYHPGYAQKTEILQKQLQQLGYRPIFSFYSSLDELENAIGNLLEYQVDGIISWDYHPMLDKEKIPTVIYETIHPGYDAVCIDGKFYADQILALARNYSQIHYIGALNNSRIAELKKSAEKNHLQIEFIPIPPVPEASLAITKKLCEAKTQPSLILCNDYHALGVYSAAYELGLKIPDDFSVIGIDNLKFSEFMCPPLTTFDLNMEDICVKLIQLLIDRIKNPEKKVEHIFVPSILISRKSINKERIGL